MTCSVEETAARAVKTLKLAYVLREENCLAEDAELFTDAQWLIASQVAGVRPPSDLTRSVVLQLLTSLENEDDPFGWPR